MTEQQLQFRVGLFVVAATAIAAVMVFQFGELRTWWERTYEVTIHFEEAPGVQPETPVKQNGIAIGRVSRLLPDAEHGGVLVVVGIREQFPLRADVQARLSRSLLGDASIVLSPGVSSRWLSAGARLRGESPPDPTEIIDRMEHHLSRTLASFEETSRQWQRVGRNVNSLLETHRGHLDEVVEQAAVALAEFTRTMRTANTALGHAGEILGDPQQKEHLRRSLAALPDLVEETRQSVAAIRTVAGSLDRNLATLHEATQPLAGHSRSLVAKLEGTLGHLQSLSAEMNEFARLVNREDGSLQRFATDPELYRNLNQSAASLAVLLEQMQPIARDLRIFSDKIARHPELIGVRGALRGSTGVKEVDGPEDAASQPASGIRRQ